VTRPVQTRVPVLVQEAAEQVAVEDIVANKEDLKLGIRFSNLVGQITTRAGKTLSDATI
jgi:hypothetical protein